MIQTVELYCVVRTKFNFSPPPEASSLVFLALVLTLSVATVDVRIALYPHQPSLW